MCMLHAHRLTLDGRKVGLAQLEALRLAAVRHILQTPHASGAQRRLHRHGAAGVPAHQRNGVGRPAHDGQAYARRRLPQPARVVGRARQQVLSAGRVGHLQQSTLGMLKISRDGKVFEIRCGREHEQARQSRCACTHTCDGVLVCPTISLRRLPSSMSHTTIRLRCACQMA